MGMKRLMGSSGFIVLDQNGHQRNLSCLYVATIKFVRRYYKNLQRYVSGLPGSRDR
jgi:hypothetical protein